MNEVTLYCGLNSYAGRLRPWLTQHQRGSAGRWILTILWCPQIVIGHLLTRDGVRVMKGHYSCVWPQHWVCAKFVRAIWIIREGRGQEGNVIRLRVTPALVKLSMPKGEVLQPEDLPHTILFDVLILVYATFPPLHQTAWVRVLDALMGAGRHHASEASFGPAAVVIHVDYALDLGMIEKESVYGAIATSHKRFGEATDVKTLHTLLAIVATAQELDTRVCMVRKEIRHLD
jgi:hypothetical protein